MPLTIEIEKTYQGYSLRRSDGQYFTLIGKPDGHAVLHATIVDLDVSVSDKLEAARRWVLAFPNQPA